MTLPLAEVHRRQSNKQRILAALQKRPHTNGELVEIGGIRYGGRIFEARKEGWDIRTEPHDRGLVVYRLLGRVEPGQKELPL